MIDFSHTNAANQGSFKPEFAIIFHSFTGSTDLVSIYHPIDGDKIDTGKYIETSELAEILFNNQISEFSLLPEGVLCHDKTRLVWHQKSFKSVYYFSDRKPLEITYPSFVFHYNKKSNEFKIFAKATNARPTPDTILYHAPVGNVSINGVLCQGNAQINIQNLNNAKECIEACYESLFNSYFTHVNNSLTFKSKTKVCNKQHYAKWESLNGKKPSAKDLVKIGTLSQLIA